MIILLIAMLGTCMVEGYGQDKDLPSERGLIVLNNNKKIKSIRLWSINTIHIEYEQNGSLHDLLIKHIKIIKLDDEVVKFDLNGKIEIRPYDVIITVFDTIKCIITKVNMLNIYFYKQRGFQKTDYIPFNMVDSYYFHADTMKFNSFKDEYFSISNI